MPFLLFFTWNTAQYSSNKQAYKERTNRTVAAATGGGVVADGDLQIRRVGHPTFFYFLSMPCHLFRFS